MPNTPRFEPITDWEKDAPPRGMISGLAFDSDDNLYACTRKKADAEAAIFVYAPSGKFLRSWGEGLFVQPHGITVTPDGYVYVIEDYGSAVRKFTRDGVHVETVGPSGEDNRSDTGADLTIKNLYQRLQTIRHDGAGPFNHPTSLAVAPNGDRYVADGYGNCKVHCFSPDGELKRSWGSAAPGRGNSTWCTPCSSRRIPRCTSATARTTGFRSSTRMAHSWASGTTFSGQTALRRTRTGTSTSANRSSGPGTGPSSAAWRPPPCRRTSR